MSPALLSETGRLVGHLDLRNIQGIERPRLLAQFRKNGWHYDGRRHLLETSAQSRPLARCYLGADDQGGRNFTGQPCVDSHYATAITTA